MFCPKDKIDPEKEQDVTGKIIIITGANAGIGRQTALELAKRGANVIMASRDAKRAEAAKEWIREQTDKGELTVMNLDLASLESVRNFARSFKEKHEKLDILINNGGVMMDPKLNQKTSDGFEIHMGVNHLSHFLLTDLLLDHLKKAAPSRIINLSSDAHQIGTLDLDDIFSEKTDNTKKPFPLLPLNILYCRSKMANVLFNHELAKRLERTGVTTYAVHPGVVKSEFTRNASRMEDFALNVMLAPIQKNVEQGAMTSLHCALHKDLENVSGEMYKNCSVWERKKRKEYTEEDAKKLWDISAKLVGMAA